MIRQPLLAALALASAAACVPDNSHLDVYGVANGCYAIADGDDFLVRDGDSYAFSAEQGAATPFFLRPSDLGTYLLHDPDGGYVVREGDGLVRQETLDSDITLVQDGYVSGAEWLVEPSSRKKDRFQLRSKQDPTRLLGSDGVVDKERKGARIRLEPAEGCAAPPELSLDAEGAVTRTTFEDGELYGIVDAHSHIFTNFGFAGSLYHGSPFHPLGVEHALHDCAIHHGEMGRKDFFGYAYDNGGADGGSLTSVITDLVVGELEEDNHATDGYPTFTDWPDARHRSTHQVQYHRWLERAYLAGLRLVVQHATTNEVICDISVGAELVPGRYDCADMVGVDRQIDAAYAMERYIDAQAGGPGKGWFRIVTTPAEARAVIADGKMAVVLGIETSNLFDCYLSPRDDSPACDLDHVREQLDRYHDRGVRVLFPVHKYDNAFSAGDGHGGFIELGNVINSGYYTSKTEDCPGLQTVFDDGPVQFKGFLEPRESYQLDEPPLDFSGIEDDPIKTLLPYFSELSAGSVEGEFCQTHGLTPLGEQLIDELMQRGMIVELDHLPQRAYQRAFEILQAADYPAVGTHGNDNRGQLYDIGGISFRELGRCHDPQQKGQSWRGYQARLDDTIAAGLHPSLGFAFDLNGFAGAPGPRFGEEASCNVEQVDPVSYPFTSVAGDVTFSEPHAGERVFDFNTEGMAHIGLFPEYVEDARKDAAGDEIDALFRSAEGYIQLWERTEARAAAHRGE